MQKLIQNHPRVIAGLVVAIPIVTAIVLLIAYSGGRGGRRSLLTVRCARRPGWRSRHSSLGFGVTGARRPFGSREVRLAAACRFDEAGAV